ncbi:zinc finger protein 567-like [Trachemys scripta elegans]|uniref:zinc finger protein 567-like n=1 Tax=Trachemys scripta elegans TaxID=31138 RepID=UPI0015583358|nr:zinc finger protein 567-like [Trachemys scripta elegans]
MRKVNILCVECGKNFSSRSALFRIHTGETPSVPLLQEKLWCPLKPHCPPENSHGRECKSSFRTRRTLTKHQKTHTGEKPYICPKCRKNFWANSTLTIHR